MKQIQIGDVVGDYRVIDTAGSGGMGEVYKIEHVITKRIEAMKLLPPASSSDPEQVQRFEREIQVQARLHHPNIVALYNAVREGNLIGLVMEFVEGESLQTKLEAGALPVATAVDYACQVLRALAYAHEAGVIHRDVAPANMIVTPERVVKLTDFGLARGVTDLRLSTTGVPVGSPWYMSPEQVKAIGPMDARTDIYAIGAVFHEMLTGTKLFDVEGAFAVMRAHVEMVPAPPSSRNPAVPVALDAIVSKAVAKDPAMRFQSADEFRLALQDAVAPPRRVMVPESPARAFYLANANFEMAARVSPFARRGGIVSGTGGVAGRFPPAGAGGEARARAGESAASGGTRHPARSTASGGRGNRSLCQRPLRCPRRRRSLRNRRAIARKPRRARCAGRFRQQNFAIRVTGGDPVPVAVAPLPAPPVPACPRTPPEPPAIESAKLPEAPSVVPPADPDVPAADQAAPPKPSSVGSRLVRALGKVNPFHKGTKQNNDAPANTPLKKD